MAVTLKRFADSFLGSIDGTPRLVVRSSGCSETVSQRRDHSSADPGAVWPPAWLLLGVSLVARNLYLLLRPA